MSTAASSTHPARHRALRQGAQAVKCPRQRGAQAAAWPNVAPFPIRAQPYEVQGLPQVPDVLR
eukprot:2657104-Pyramimonas_sp.AAC.1